MFLPLSGVQLLSKDSSKLRFISYFGTFISLSILTNPASVLFSFATLFFRSEIKTFYVYKEIKAAKREKVTKKEYWEIFFKNNIIKLISFSLFSAFITYVTFTSTFLLVSLLGTIPLAMLLILLQSELRPKDFNPITLFKDSIKFFLEGIKENSRSMVNKFDNISEHLLPHQLNDDINDNISELKNKYGKKIPEDVIKNNEFIQFIQYIENSHEFSDEDKGKAITFLNDFCSNDQQHSSMFTGGQILLLVLRACNDGDRGSIKSKKDALIANLIDTQIFSRKERIPNTCFTGVIYRMLGTLEGIHANPEIRFTPPRQILLSGAESEARLFMLGRLKEKKNNKEIFNAWYKIQDDHDDASQNIVDDFISEIRIPLMRKLLSFTSQYSEQIVLTLMKNVSSIKLNKLRSYNLSYHIEGKLKEHGLEKQESLFENIEAKVFLKLLDKDLLDTSFFLKHSSENEAKRIADDIMKEEIRGFKLRAEKTIEGQVTRILDGLKTLPQNRKCYRVYAELSKSNENYKQKIKKILQEKLEVEEIALDEMLKKEASSRLELEVEDIYDRNKNKVSQLYDKIREIEKEFVKYKLLGEGEINSIVKEKIKELTSKDVVMPSQTLSNSLSVSNLAMYHL